MGNIYTQSILGVNKHKKTGNTYTESKTCDELPPCYSYIQPSPAKVLAVPEETKHLRKK